MKNIMKFVKKVSKRLIDVLAILSSIITIASVFFPINDIVRYVFLGIATVFIMGVIVYIVKSIIDINKARVVLERSYFSSLSNISTNSHKYFHNIRNYISSMNWNSISSEKDIMDQCKNICNYLAEFYKHLFYRYLDGNDVSVCIKIIKTDNVYDEDYLNWEMETIARSVSTTQSRNNIDRKPVKISGNTDFQIILSKDYEDELFSFPDMSNIYDDFLKTYKIEYRNSRQDFYNYYRSTIVVPIKIDGRFASNELSAFMNNLDSRSLVLGFLCIDSMKVFASEQEQEIFKIGTEFAKSMADSLYIFFEKALISFLSNTKVDEYIF